MCNLFETFGPQDFSKDFKKTSDKFQKCQKNFKRLERGGMGQSGQRGVIMEKTGVFGKSETTLEN